MSYMRAWNNLPSEMAEACGSFKTRMNMSLENENNAESPGTLTE